MRIVIPGGSGQVGTLLARALQADGNDIVVLSRRPSGHQLPYEAGAALAPWRSVAWDAREEGPWIAELDGADVVINLAGRNVNCRYTPENRRAILSSRVDSARAVGRAIAACRRPPRVWLQASTATIYSHRFDAANDEHTGIIGGQEPDAPASWRFSIDVATAWERAAQESVPSGTRLVLLRAAMVMSPDRGGIFDMLLRIARLGLGGPVAGGRQFVSWVHDRDFIRALNWLIAHEELAGPVNVAAPNPLPYREFMRAIRRAARMPVGLPATARMVQLGTWALRTESELVLKSRRVVPARLLESGFEFEHPDWPAAARDLVHRARLRVTAKESRVHAP